MNQFGLRRKNQVTEPTAEILTHPDPKTMELAFGRGGKRKSSRLQQVAKYFQTHPLPFSSLRGSKFIRGTVAGLAENPAKLANQVDKSCNEPIKSKVRPSTFPIKTSNNMTFKPEQYVHEFTFTRRQKIRRNTELVLGK